MLRLLPQAECSPVLALLFAFCAASSSAAVQPAGAGNRTAAAAAVQCVRQVDACRCETASGGRIDLSPLAKSGDFAFGNRMGPSGQFNYFFNPCNGATCDGSTNAAACQRATSGSFEYLLGTQDSATFETDPQIGLVLKYTGLSGDSQLRQAQVQLVCDSSGGGVSLFTPLNDGLSSNPIVYKMSLLSSYCCEVGPVTTPGGGGGGSGGLSVGDILLIATFSLAFAYLAVGLAVNILVLKRSRSEALPNVTFWVALPGVVRDGAVFTFCAVKRVATRRGGEYQSV